MPPAVVSAERRCLPYLSPAESPSNSAFLPTFWAMIEFSNDTYATSTEGGSDRRGPEVGGVPRWSPAISRSRPPSALPPPGSHGSVLPCSSCSWAGFGPKIRSGLPLQRCTCRHISQHARGLAHFGGRHLHPGNCPSGGFRCRFGASPERAMPFFGHVRKGRCRFLGMSTEGDAVFWGLGRMVMPRFAGPSPRAQSPVRPSTRGQATRRFP